MNVELKQTTEVRLKVGDVEYSLTNVNGELKIATTGLGTVLSIVPSCSNVIFIETKQMFK